MDISSLVLTSIKFGTAEDVSFQRLHVSAVPPENECKKLNANIGIDQLEVHIDDIIINMK